MKRFNAVISLLLCVIMIVTSFPLGILSAERVASDSVTGPVAKAGSINNDLLQSSKTVTYNGDGTYTLKMDGYATASAIPQYNDKIQPTDVVIVFDRSGSQDQCVACNSDLSSFKFVPWTDVNGKYDTSKAYYIDNDNAIHYCNDCGKWFDQLHCYGYHGGNICQPYRNNSSNYLRVFYTEKTTNSTTVYNPDKNSQYCAKFGSNGGSWHDIVYCSVCDGWYNATADNKEEHATGNHDGSYIVIPKTSAEDTTRLVKFHQAKTCSVTGTECVAKHVTSQKAAIQYIDSLYSSAIGPDGKFGTSDDINHVLLLFPITAQTDIILPYGIPTQLP